MKINAVMSTPRLSFTANMFCCVSVLNELRIPLKKHESAFWSQSLTRVIEKTIQDDGPDWILTIDYDTLFDLDCMATLIRTIKAYPEIDALCAVQVHRVENRPLLTLAANPDGTFEPRVPVEHFYKDITKLHTGHFGLTLLKAEKFQSLKKPWFHSTPDTAGSWHDGHVDDDTFFWLNWHEAGNTLYQANRAPVGHAQLMARWPDEKMCVFYDDPQNFYERGRPPEVWK